MNEAFVLDEELKNRLTALTNDYSTKLAALLPALNIIQDKFGFIPPEAEQQIAELLDIFPTQVREVTTFYSLFYNAPVGHHKIYVCYNLSCCIEGGGKLLHYLAKKLRVSVNETTRDGKFSLYRTPCTGACEKAPVIIVNGAYHYNVTPEYIDELLTKLG
ncbi:MAG: hypothetical protein A2Y62_07270 [Candidatus Fischerbacteria bacterium RBG_13_37_8]|uniref:NADH dehydrogenase n=1 Tax=Candidatus Fischerbacteria bacterium RBG_13_37_8 TaxID=1817863 RepID=A0A1F5VJ35_9BACT|nr:MAG: hypothetical protein A2Y62_07270 [Candidatus Fischerbacteria bacterium RBG_13_37_8]